MEYLRENRGVDEYVCNAGIDMRRGWNMINEAIHEMNKIWNFTQDISRMQWIEW